MPLAWLCIAIGILPIRPALPISRVITDLSLKERLPVEFGLGKVAEELARRNVSLSPDKNKILISINGQDTTT